MISEQTTEHVEVAAAETHAEVRHEHTLFAEKVFDIAGFPVTNSLINSWFAIVAIVIIAAVLRLRIRLIPGMLQNIFESAMEAFFDMFDSVTGSRERTLKFFPLVFTFFILILVNNWIGILPGIGSIGYYATEHGEQVFVPFFRGATADLNTTLALAIVGVVSSHIFGIVSIGAWTYINKFFNFKAVVEISKKVFKEPAIIMVNTIKVFVGFIEIVGEAAKVASLSFRLFGNVFAGEVLLASMAAISAFFLPIPFMFLEIMVGLIQALIFAMLILIYLTVMTAKEEH